MATSKDVKVNIIVTRSFGSLNEGEQFEGDPSDAWVKAHMDAGLLKEATRGEGESEAREG